MSDNAWFCQLLFFAHNCAWTSYASISGAVADKQPYSNQISAFLEQFQKDWKYHHPLSGEQLDLAGVVNIVKGAAFCHGGDSTQFE
jgi:hypothetical protein